MKIIKLTAILSLATFASLLAYNEPAHAKRGSKGGGGSNLPVLDAEDNQINNPAIDFNFFLEDELGNLITDSDGNLNNTSGTFLNVIQDFSYSIPDPNDLDNKPTDTPYFQKDEKRFFFDDSGDLFVDFLENVETKNGFEDVISYKMEVKSEIYTFNYNFFFTETQFKNAGITNSKDELVNSLSGFEKLINSIAPDSSTGQRPLLGSLSCDTGILSFIEVEDPQNNICKQFDKTFVDKFKDKFGDDDPLADGRDPDNLFLQAFTEIDIPDSKTVPEFSNTISLLALGIVGIGSALRNRIVKI